MRSKAAGCRVFHHGVFSTNPAASRIMSAGRVLYTVLRDVVVHPDCMIRVARSLRCSGERDGSDGLSLWRRRTGGGSKQVDNPKIVLRPLIGLLVGQPKDMIERLTIEAISKHRCLVSEAELAYDRFKNQAGELEISEAHEAYLSSMIAVHAQQTVVSTLLDILGYIPPMPTSKAH